MKTIGVVTSARSDYGIYLPILRKIQADGGFNLKLLVSGMHLSPEFGMTIKTIEADGFDIIDRIETLLSSDSPGGIAKSMGIGVMGFAQAFTRFHPDILMVLGDRYEMYTAALAALPFKIPIAHIHGGEVTQGAIDDSLRHSLTKLSHLHFVSTQEYARRVIQLGEEPWRVTVSGSPSLDNLKSIRLFDKKEIKTKYGFNLDTPSLLVTFHPVTLEYEQTEWQVKELISALDDAKMPVIFTMANADTSNRIITRLIDKFVDSHSSAYKADNLGIQGYFSVMAFSAAMVGNSSSGIIEAASFELPVVNVGTRQQGRVKGINVIDVGYERDSILQAIQKSLDSKFRAQLHGIRNPYYFKEASEIIVESLKQIQLDDRLVNKLFYDLDSINLDGEE